MTEHVVSVVAGGWSFGRVDHTKVPGEVIGVNDTLLYWKGLQPLDAVLSMDRLWSEHRWFNMCGSNIPAYLRKGTLSNIPYIDQSTNRPLPWVHTYECDINQRTFGEDDEHLNGRNSGACALNLAYVRRPTALFLFGFDMGLSQDGKAHWYAPYTWSKGRQGNTGHQTYLKWASDCVEYKKQFDAIGCKVYNVSLGNALGIFERVSAEELGCAL